MEGAGFISAASAFILVSKHSQDDKTCQRLLPFSFSQEVPMIPRPHYAQPGCVYFICLLRDDLLLRQGECVDFLGGRREIHNIQGF